MRAAVYYGRRDLRVEEAPVSTPGEKEVLLEVRAAGICGTDAAEWSHGPTMLPIIEPNRHSRHAGPLIIGHEFGGRVVARGKGVVSLPEGALVACGAGVSCGVCPSCRVGATNLCDSYYTLGLQRNGGMAQYVTAPARICLPVDELPLSDEGAALVQPMSIALHSFRQGNPASGSAVLVVGVGGVGAFLVYAAAQSGADVVAADLDPERLNIARALGASGALRVGPGSPLVDQLREELSEPPTVVYEVTGNAHSLQAALDVVAKPGTVVAVGLQKVDVAVDVRTLTLDETRLVGTNAHVFDADFADAARLVASRTEGWRDVAPAPLPLEQVVDAGVLPMVEGTVNRIKTLIDPGLASS